MFVRVYCVHISLRLPALMCSMLTDDEACVHNGEETNTTLCKSVDHDGY